MKKGTVKLYLQDTDGNMHGIYLQNALYAPSYKQNIFPVQSASERCAIIDFSESMKLVNHDVRVWYEIFGHCNVQDVLKLPAVMKGMNITDKTSKICETCTLGKMTEFRSRVPDEKGKLPLELVHCDLTGLVDPVSIDGYRDGLSFTDDYSGLIMTYFLKQRSDTVEATKKFLADVPPFGKVKCLKSDNGSEFISKYFEVLLVSYGIRHEKSAPHSPHQNGTAQLGAGTHYLRWVDVY